MALPRRRNYESRLCKVDEVRRERNKRDVILQWTIYNPEKNYLFIEGGGTGRVIARVMRITIRPFPSVTVSRAIIARGNFIIQYPLARI